jgi:hypothetical protein
VAVAVAQLPASSLPEPLPPSWLSIGPGPLDEPEPDPEPDPEPEPDPDPDPLPELEPKGGPALLLDPHAWLETPRAATVDARMKAVVKGDRFMGARSPRANSRSDRTSGPR